MRKQAVIKLSKAVETVYSRTSYSSYSYAGDTKDTTSFDNFCKSNISQRFLSHHFPLSMYKRWKKHIEQKLDGGKKANIERSEEMKINDGSEAIPLMVKKCI